MTRPFEQWTVLPHGKLVQIDDNILTVVGEIHMPLMDLPRRMTVKVQEAVQVDTGAPLFDDPNVQFVAVPGTRGREAALVVRTPKGTTLVLNDVVGNIRDAAGFGGWLLKMAGFAGTQAHIPKVVKMAIIEDTNALRAQLLEWSEIASLKCILVSHGSPIEENPRQVLRDLAGSLT